MSSEEKVTGGCLCGAIRYEITEAPRRANMCHCRMCQRWTGGGFAAGAEYSDQAITWSRSDPGRYQSSQRGNRLFCAACGSSIGYQYPDEGTIWITLGTHDDPERMHPRYHIFVDEQRSWVKLDDGLPRHRQLVSV